MPHHATPPPAPPTIRALTPEVAAFAGSGLTTALGVADAAGRPLSTFCHACVADPERGELRMVASRRGNARLLAALEAGGAVAASFTDLAHRSVQVKAARARIEPATPRDIAEYERQSAIHGQWLGSLGFAPGFAAGFVRCDLADAVMVVFVPQAAFRQTPGPGAGRPLQPGERFEREDGRG